MLNIDHFLKRLESLMENNHLNATAFAEKIDVQRSSVSHILSKRNKPSLEFILKINEHFEEADLEWLLLGEKQDQEKHPTLLNEKVEVSEIDAIEHKTKYEITQGMPQKNENSNTDEISQIIQLYKDGSFRTYFPKS
ncbi:helix-turn-helix domain-containing protein [Flavobacteriaceae bacterium]|nr:helix-turn-helix domain-containing protein [Flavobacteriaceae bacterium]MDB2695582.1 helix-turn-helix domain-containing protein [Flavobacteriaceae bacterium]